MLECLLVGFGWFERFDMPFPELTLEAEARHIPCRSRSGATLSTGAGGVNLPKLLEIDFLRGPGKRQWKCSKNSSFHLLYSIQGKTGKRVKLKFSLPSLCFYSMTSVLFK